MSLHHWLLFVSAFPVLCLAISCTVWILRRKLFSQPLQILGYFLLFNLAIEIGARLIVYYLPNNLPLLHLYTLGELILLSLFYRYVLPVNLFKWRHFAVFIAFISLLIILNTIFLQSIFVFNSYSKTLVQIIIILYSILFFFHLPETPGFRQPEAWSLRVINSAVLIYYCGSLFIFMFSNIFIEKSIIYHGFWIFNALLNFLFQILVLIGLWRVAFKRPKLSF